MGLVQAAIKVYWRHFSCFRVICVSFICLPHTFFGMDLCLFINNKFSSKFNKSLLQGQAGLKMISRLVHGNGIPMGIATKYLKTLYF